MAKITKFDPTTLKMLRPEIQAVLDMIYDEYGVKLEMGGFSYKDNTFHTKLTGYCGEDAGKDKNEHYNDKLAETFTFYAEMIGFQKSDLNREFKFRDKAYTLVGYNKKAKQYPLVGKDIKTGAYYKFTVIQIKKAMGIELNVFEKKGGF